MRGRDRDGIETDESHSTKIERVVVRTQVMPVHLLAIEGVFRADEGLVTLDAEDLVIPHRSPHRHREPLQLAVE